MTRHDRRAAKSVLKKLPEIPNISGTAAACGTCRFASDRGVVEKITKTLAARELVAGRPAPQMLADDEVYCLYEPQERLKKTFGWCGKHEAK